MVWLLKQNVIPSSSDDRRWASAVCCCCSCCCGIGLRLDLESGLDPDSMLGLELRAARSAASSREVASEKIKTMICTFLKNDLFDKGPLDKHFKRAMATSKV